MKSTLMFLVLAVTLLIMTNSANGEGIYKTLLEVLLRDKFTPIAVGSNTLDTYAGRYSVSADLILIVVRRDNHLIVKEGSEDHEMIPESENHFFSKTADDEITFNVDAHGQTTEMILQTGGRTMRFKKLE
jgi:hypothetical protein